MKRVVSVLMVVIMCFSWLAGCSSTGPSKSQIKKDVIREYFENPNKNLSKYKKFDIVEVIDVQVNDGIYYTKIKGCYEIEYRVGVVLEQDIFFELVYRQNDAGDWVFDVLVVAKKELN